MKKIITAILIILLLLLFFRFGMLMFKIILQTGITLLKIAVRFWYLWLAIFVYSLLKEDASKRKKKSTKDIIDADFTIVDEKEEQEEKENETKRD
jgi:hypothetical protein